MSAWLSIFYDVSFLPRLGPIDRKFFLFDLLHEDEELTDSLKRIEMTSFEVHKLVFNDNLGYEIDWCVGRDLIVPCLW